MVIHTANNHALRKYEEFTGAIETVRIALEETDPLIRSMKDSNIGRNMGWRVPDKKEVAAARTHVVELLITLRQQAKQYEKELIANGWRV